MPQFDNPLDGRCAPPISQEAAREMLATLSDAEEALQHSESRQLHCPEPQSRHMSALLRVRRAIEKAEGR